MVMNSANVAIKTPRSSEGVLFWAPANVAIDSDPSVPLPAEFKSVGFIAESGITFSDGQEAGEAKRAFGGKTVINGTTTTNQSVTFGLIEVTNGDAMMLAYDDSTITVLEDGGLKIADDGTLPGAKTLVFEFALKDDMVERVVARNCEFSTRGDRVIDNENYDTVELTYMIRTDDKGTYRTSHVAKIVSA